MPFQSVGAEDGFAILRGIRRSRTISDLRMLTYALSGRWRFHTAGRSDRYLGVENMFAANIRLDPVANDI